VLVEANRKKCRRQIANARLVYQEFKRLFSTPRFETLKNSGARVQRPLWASTSTKNPAYRDVLYAAVGHRGEEDGTWVIRRT